MKKILIVFTIVALVMSLSACGNNPSSNTPNTSGSNVTSGESENTSKPEQTKELIYDSTDAYEYSEVENGIVITHFSNSDKVEYDKIIIPAEIDGKTVVGIGSLDAEHRIFGAIYGNCEVVIPDTVEYIAAKAFNGASGLVKVSGGENCKKICEYAFINCENLTEITFINNVTDLADNAFAGCTAWEANH